MPTVGFNDLLGLSETAGDRLADVGTGKNGRHALVSTLLQAVFCRLAGYGVVNDAERLAMIRRALGGRAARGAASPSIKWGGSLPPLLQRTTRAT